MGERDWSAGGRAAAPGGCKFKLAALLLLLAPEILLSVSSSRVEPQQPQQQQQPPQPPSLSIPAANPNFEAAFQGECGKNNNSNPCEHICLDLHDGTYECSCFYGFTLAVDGYSCARLPAPSDAANRSSAAAAAAGEKRQPQPSRRAAGDEVASSLAAANWLVVDRPTDLEFSDFDRVQLDEDEQQQDEERENKDEKEQTNIRSIMRSNDRLLEQLAARLRPPEQPREPPLATELAKLADLVRLTMRSRLEPAAERAAASSPEFNEPSAGAGPLAKLNRSSRQSAPDPTRDRPLELTPNCATHPDGANYSKRRRASHYRSCAELPECESGGRCLEEAGRPARCQCPIGRGGLLCQKPIQRRVPDFSGHSYLALPMITESSIARIRLLFKPSARKPPAARSSLLLAAADFLLLLDDLNRIELRYLTAGNGDGSTSDNQLTRVIGSRDVVLGGWNELIVTDASSDVAATNTTGELDETSLVANRIVLVTPDRIQLSQSRRGQLFLAGIPEPGAASFQLADGGPAAGFRGCIGRLQVEPRDYRLRSDLEGDALDGFDIGECTSCPHDNQ